MDDMNKKLDKIVFLLEKIALSLDSIDDTMDDISDSTSDIEARQKKMKDRQKEIKSYLRQMVPPSITNYPGDDDEDEDDDDDFDFGDGYDSNSFKVLEFDDSVPQDSDINEIKEDIGDIVRALKKQGDEDAADDLARYAKSSYELLEDPNTIKPVKIAEMSRLHVLYAKYMQMVKDTDDKETGSVIYDLYKTSMKPPFQEDKKDD